MEALEEQLSYKFRDPELLQTALTHSTLTSTSNSSPLNTKKRSCDHLKILGDCVIKLLTSQYAICVSIPNDKVHKIVRIKDNLSNRYCQNLVGKSLRLEEKGIIVTNLQQEQIFGHLDTFVKSLFGAIFLDAGGSEKKGLITCWKVFLKLWRPVISSFDPAKQLIDCFPEPTYSSREFLKERFSDFKADDLKLLEEKIGYTFVKNPHLLEQAMTHDSIDMFRSSVDNPDPSKPEFVHFQNLEFLGDSVLELVIMEYLYLRSSSADPLGQMLFFNRDTGQKLYSSRFQIQVAKKLQLENFVIKPPNAPLASYDDFVESLIGSIYVHGRMVGLRICAKIVLEIWGLEEDVASTKQTSQKPEPVSVKISEADNKENIATIKPVVLKPAVPASAVPPMVKPPPPPKQQPKHNNKAKPNDLQVKIGYKFSNASLLSYLPAFIDVTSTDARAKSMNIINTCKNLQTVGKRVIDLVAVEYVIGLCHSTPKADLSAEMKKTFQSLRSTLVGDQVLQEITARFELEKFWDLKQDDQTKPSTVSSASEIIYLIFGAVFVDSSGDHSSVYKLFSRMWNSYTSGTKQPESLIQCFPDTSENQQKFREAVTVRTPISIKMWTKLWYQLGHTCTRKNLLEQAFTDEKSQGYAKQQLNAYPLGNPFGLQILGKSLVDLYVAYRCYLNTVTEPEIFPGLILRMDQSLFNVLKNTFDIERYYAHHSRYPYPPNKNPRAPFEALLGAVYVDVGGGGVGFRQMEAVIVKACPTLITMRRLKAVKQPVGPSSESGVDCSSPAKLSASNSRQRGEDSVSDGGSVSLSVVSSSSSPMKKGKQEDLNTSFDSQDNSTSGKSTPLHTSFLTAAPVEQDPILSEFETKLAYKFVNPMLLRIVLEINIPVSQQNCPVNSQNYFQIFKIVGNRALALLATEFALESLAIPKKADISAKDKKQVKSHRDHLTGPLVADTIAKCISLDKYVFTSAAKSDIPCNGDFITALMGAVFIDSRANYLKISALFNKLWKQNLNALPTHPILIQCFPLTTEGQAKLRIATSTQVAEAKWKKFNTKLGHVFKNRNLLEQALTDENSQELAKTKHNAYPTGNTFALRLLGKCVIQLVIAYKTLPNSPDAQATNYAVGLENIEQALYNNFQNNFLGVDKYYACIKQQKNQKFPPKDNPFSPYQAVMGAVYVDSGTGNKGLDTVGMVIIKRSVGLKTKKKITTGPGLVDALPVPNGTPTTTRERALSSCSSSSNLKTSCSTPDPGANSSSCSEGLNTSFSSKCAANFSISPSPVASAKKSPPKPLVKPREEPVPEEPCCSKSLIATPVTSAVTRKMSPPAIPLTPKTSPKKQQKMQQQKSYASALISGKPVVEVQSNKLFLAVTNAQSQIEALRKKQETIDHNRKLSIEKQQKQQNDISDEIGSNCSLPRSRCASTSTITSTGSQQQAVGDASGQKRKLGGKGGKKKNKKVKGVVPPKQVIPLQQQKESSPRVSAWCQNQMDRLQQEVPSSTSTVAGNVPSSCTTPEVHYQRSTVNQLQASIRGMDEDGEISCEFPLSPTRSAAVLGTNSQNNGNYVPVHMVSGYRKTVVDGDRFGSKTKNAGGKLGSSELASRIASEDGEEEPPSGISYMSVLKWTSLILGVAFLLKRYSQGK